MNDAEHLLLIGLGPVQDFIRTARRCRDYWYGSRLLSDLAKVAAGVVEERCGAGALIFPPGVPSDPNVAVANKVLARVPGAAAAEVAEAARGQVIAAVRARWDALVGDVPEDARAMVDAKRGRAQIDDLIELQWVAVPIGDDYPKARLHAERSLSARKMTRDWRAPEWGDGRGVPKSSLDGAREQVLDEKLRKQWSVRQPWRLREALDVRPHESLCGPGLLKRRGLPVEVSEGDPSVDAGEREVYRHFHSTSHMAAAPLLTRLAWAPADAALSELRRRLREDAGLSVDQVRVRLTDERDGQGGAIRPAIRPLDGGPAVHPLRVFALKGREGAEGYDGSLFFEGRLPALIEECPTKETKAVLEGKAGTRQRRAALDERIEKARAALNACLDAMGVRGAPCPYYGFLLADGDHMGDAFAAVARGGVDDAIGAHRTLAGRLAGFAARAREIVIEHGGSPIYAGGDDISALVPLHTALQCARALRDAFDDMVGRALPAAARPTLSVGLAIVHHMAAMSEARALAEHAERLAKDPAFGGRGALAIVADKRSGARLEIYGKWDASAADAPAGLWGIDRRLRTWCGLYRQGRLPHGAAFELEALLRPFEIQAPGAADDSPAEREQREATREATRDAVRRLAERVIRRRRVVDAGGAVAMDDGTRAALVAQIDADPLEDVRRLSRELQVARVMLKALEDAWGPGEEAQS